MGTFGLPPGPVAKWYAIAAFSSALGTGMFLPYLLLFLHRSEGLSLSVIGGVLTAATLVSVGLIGLVGQRVAGLPTSRSMAQLHLFRAGGRALFLLAAHPVAFVVAALVDAATMRLAQMQDQSLVMSFGHGSERRLWFALSRSMLNAGLGIGAALGAGLALFTDDLRVVLVLNVALLCFAAYAYARLGSMGEATPPADASTVADEVGHPVRAWRDSVFVRFGLAETALWTCSLVVELALPFVIVERSGLPTWCAGALFVLASVIVTLTQGPITRAMRNVSLTRSMVAASVLHGVGLALLILSPSSLPVAAAVAVAAITLFSFGEVMSGFAGPAAISALAPPGAADGYVASFHTMLGLGSAVAPLLVTSALVVDDAGPWIVGVLLAITSLALVSVRAHATEPRLIDTAPLPVVEL